MFRQLLLILFYSIPLFGQQSGELLLTGIVLDHEDGVVPYATIAILDQNKKIVSYATCALDGKFELQKVSPGTYTLQISCLGYTPISVVVTIHPSVIDIGIFRLQRGIALEEIIVGGPLILTKPDRIIYNVKQDTTTRNLVALQVLEKLPFITVDQKTGRIQVMGEGNFAITINGKKSLLLSEANQYVANLLQAERIKQIELITSPEGTYQDKTSVINIITDDRLSDGIVGEVMVEFDNRFFTTQMGITSKINRFIYTVDYQPDYIRHQRLNSNTLIFNNSGEKHNKTISEHTEWSKDFKQALRLNASYDISENDLLTLSGLYGYDKRRGFKEGSTFVHDLSGQIIDSYHVSANDALKNNSYTGAINYQRSFKEHPGKLFTATYRQERGRSSNDYEHVKITGDEDDPQFSVNNLKLSEQMIAVDFSDARGLKHSYFVTGRVVFRHYESGTSYIYGEGEPSDLNYDQYLSAFKVSHTFRHKKLMLTTEVNLENVTNRVEFSSDEERKNRHFFNIRPRLSFLYRTRPKSSLSLSYNVFSFRPDVRYLNPYANTSNPSHIYVGNPNLKSELLHVIGSSYQLFSKKVSSNFTATYKYSDNAIFPYDRMNEENILETTHGNIGKSYHFSFGMNSNYTNAGKFEAWIRAKAVYTKYINAGYEFPLWNFDATVGSTTYIKKKCYLQAVGWVNPLSTSVQNTKFNYFIGYSLRVGYMFNERVVIQLDAEKFLKKSLTGKDEKHTDTFYYYQKKQLPGRSISLAFRYAFGRLNASVKEEKRGVKNEDRTKLE